MFYGLSHLAVDCLAQKYGEPKLLEFASLTLRKTVRVDQTSARVFGTPFRPVDQACHSWIRQQT